MIEILEKILILVLLILLSYLYLKEPTLDKVFCFILTLTAFFIAIIKYWTNNEKILDK